ncbi:tRNA(Phe) (4-demethylwyosine(37)-C(7)) aminocarboxypropyltransferase [Diplonema papillatum]|nr:tRNA(Phe) (4-demethylwyosine(37)-C(7)) aminocarboxypropyltransferase [Diplonema papillatum]
MTKAGAVAKKRKAPRESPREKVVRLLREAGAGAAVAEAWAPSKWEQHGDVVVVRLNDDAAADEARKKLVGGCVQEALSARLVLHDAKGVVGELRQPGSCEVIAGSGSTVAKHVENGVSYTFDAAQIMFSSGNTTERIHAGAATKKGQVLVDMFAGIGYFTLPVLKQGGAVVAIEKNPVSASYLKRNAEINKVDQRVTIYEGDNRYVANEHLSTADRVSMGFFDGREDAAPFLPRALCFLKPSGGVLHYHYLSTKEAALQTPADHFAVHSPQFPFPVTFIPATDPLPGVTLFFTPGRTARVAAVRRVKSYRPQTYHFVADIEVTAPWWQRACSAVSSLSLLTAPLCAAGIIAHAYCAHR